MTQTQRFIFNFIFNFRDHDLSKYGKESEIDCQCPRQWTGLVTPRILQEVETFIAKFPMAEVLTCPEDKLSKCPTEILEEIFQSVITSREGLILTLSILPCPQGRIF